MPTASWPTDTSPRATASPIWAWGRQRLENVVIGDPAHPDLVADWLEARTAIGLHGPYLTGVRGGRVRVRARWVNGRLSLGSLDRLLPAGKSGKPFALPALALAIDDLRAAVETPWGRIGAKLVGSGRLDGGFDGRLAVTGLRVGTADCAAAAPAGAFAVRTSAATPLAPARVRIEGSAQASGVACAGASAGYLNASGGATVSLGARPDIELATDLAMQEPRGFDATAQRAVGTLRLHGRLTRPTNNLLLHFAQVERGALTARRVAVDASLHLASADTPLGVSGLVDWAGGRWRGTLPQLTKATGGNPLARRLDAALAAAASDVSGRAPFALILGKSVTTLSTPAADLRTASGATLTLRPDSGPIWSSENGLRLTGRIALAGGGLPDTTIRFDPAARGAVRGFATVAPYAAGDARLALTPVRFSRARSGWRIMTRATLSGPLPGGRVEALTLPLDVRGQAGGIALVGGCVPVSWQRLAVSGLQLDPATLRLCGSGGALVSVANGRVGGGATIGATRLTGRLGSTPLTLAATGARVQLTGRRFALTGVAARLGRPERVTTLTAASLDGAFSPSGITGSFAGAGGRIGAVPLVMADAAGNWRFAGGTLAVDGGLTVSDAQTDRSRFRPLPVRDIALTLRGNAIEATGQLRAPDATRMVAAIRLTHDLAAGAGNARFTVPSLVFDKALQPDRLTPVTFGVVADVRGTVTGEGAIDWTPAGVTSTGSFTTEGTDLAAAFGPVQGIAGTIRFTDLLALESAPGQRFHVREVNPGIAVTDGTVTFQTLANARVAVAGARWPFAGGTLTLDPTLLDFGEQAKRRLTFRLAGAAADQFLQQFDFKNLDATGTFDGVLPMVFDEAGGRIEDGALQVRPGGGTLAYVGAISQKDVGLLGQSGVPGAEVAPLPQPRDPDERPAGG